MEFSPVTACFFGPRYVQLLVPACIFAIPLFVLAANIGRHRSQPPPRLISRTLVAVQVTLVIGVLILAAARTRYYWLVEWPTLSDVPDARVALLRMAVMQSVLIALVVAVAVWSVSVWRKLLGSESSPAEAGGGGA